MRLVSYHVIQLFKTFSVFFEHECWILIYHITKKSAVFVDDHLSLHHFATQ